MMTAKNKRNLAIAILVAALAMPAIACNPTGDGKENKNPPSWQQDLREIPCPDYWAERGARDCYVPR